MLTHSRKIIMGKIPTRIVGDWKKLAMGLMNIRKHKKTAADSTTIKKSAEYTPSLISSLFFSAATNLTIELVSPSLTIGASKLTVTSNWAHMP